MGDVDHSVDGCSLTPSLPTGRGAVERTELNMADDEEQIRTLIERWADTDGDDGAAA
jgi:hypothetical protein